MKVRDSLDSSNGETVEFKISRERINTKSKITIPEFVRADFGLLRDLLIRISWDVVIREKRGPRGLADFHLNI